MLLTIYLSGVMICWILFKIIRVADNDKSWTGVFVSLFISAFSWLGVVYGIAIIPMLFEERWGIFKKIKPPRWL